MSEKLDILQTVFEHRLHQADLERIMQTLSAADRQEFEDKLGELLTRISSLCQVSNAVCDSMSLDVMLPRLMDIVTDELGADRSALFLYDAETRELFSRVAQGDAVGEIRFPGHLGIAGSVFSSGEPAIVPDAYEDSRFNPEVDKETGYRTHNILCAPIKNKDKVIGVTEVLNKHEGDFDLEDLGLLEELTSRAAATLEYAHLHEKMERARSEEAKLLEVTSAIVSELQLDALLAKIIRVTTELLGAERSTLFMHDPKTDELWSHIAEGMEGNEIRFSSSEGIAGSCFTSGESINIADAYSDPSFNPEVDRKTGFTTRNILTAPLINKKGRKLGVVQVLNKKGGSFDALDEKRLQAFTAQAAIALENSQLFEDALNEKNYSSSILKSLSNGVITLDDECRIIIANEAALDFLRLGPEEIAHRHVAELFPGKDNAWLLKSLDKVIRTGQADLAMDADLGIGGRMTSVNLNIVPITDVNEEATGYMLVIEDITQEKRIKSTMARYMTKEVVDRLVEEGGEDVLGGHAQVATVLFSDIRHFTTIAEEIGPRETVSMLNEYFTDMIDVIFGHNGILDKYIGDSIMALFGTPFSSPDDASNAIMVSNEMIKSLRAFNNHRASEGKPRIRIGVGVNTGGLIAGNIGSPKRMDYTVIGDIVNLAARIESATKYYGVRVLFSEHTAAKLNHGLRYREIDRIRVMGKHEPVAVFESLDHHTKETFPAIDKVMLAFEKGLHHYRRRDWAQAKNQFEAALTANPKDKPSQLFFGRCKRYLETPPGDDWTGVWAMRYK